MGQTLVLVRHGATPWNESGYCQGRRDVALSAAGRTQAERLREALAGVRFDRAFSSPLSRARETARLLGQEPEILYDLIELDRGHWEGHDSAEIQRRWGKLHRAWYDDPRGLGMPGGETFDEIWERAGNALKRIRECGAQTVLACGHKALNRVLIARALGRPSKGVWAIPQPQACRTVLVRGNGNGTWTAETIGDTSHLPATLIASS